MAMLSSTFQTFITNYVASYLEKMTNSKIEIGHIYFKPFRSIELKHVYLSDDNQDTLIYVDRLETAINWIDFDNTHIWLSSVEVDSAKLYFIADSAGELNLTRFLNKIVGPDTTNNDTSSGEFILGIGKLDVKKTRFRIKSYGTSPLEKGVNFEDMYLQNISLDASDFKLVNSDVYLDVNQLSFKEQSGLKIDTLQGMYSMDSLGIQLSEFKLAFDSTRIIASEQALLFNGFDKMSNFLDEVTLQANIKESRIRSADLARIVPELEVLNFDVKMSGELSGPISRLNGKNVKVSLTDSTFIDASFSIRGLPDVENMFVMVNMHALEGYRNDLGKLPILLNENSEPPLPELISNFSFKGDINGFMSDLSAQGTVRTNLGSLKMNVAYRQSDDNEIDINGSLNIYQLSIDKLLGDFETFGKTALLANLNARFLPDGTFKTNIDSDVRYFDFNGNRIKDIQINGDFSEEAFDGDIVVRDPLLNMDFTGYFEYGTEQLAHRFLLNLHHVDLAALKLDTDSVSELNCDIMANIEGLDPNKISGSLNILDMDYKRGNDSIHLHELIVDAKQENLKRSIAIKSDYLSLDLTGRFELTDLSPAVSQLVGQYSPQIAWDTISIPDNETNFEFALNMINIQPLVQLFIPQVVVSNNTSFSGRFNRAENLLLVEGKSERLEVAGMKLNDMNFRAFNSSDRIHTIISSHKFNYAGDYALTDLKLNSIVKTDSIDLNVNWDNSIYTDSAIYSGNINTSIYYNEQDTNRFERFSLNLEPSFIVIADTLWNISQSRIEVDSSSYRFQDFTIENGYQYLQLEGAVSENSNDTLRIAAENVNISPLNLFTEGTGLNLEGILNANIKISQIYASPFVGSNVDLNKLTINGQLIGDTKVSTEWDPFLEMIHLEWLSTIMETEVLNIVGDFDPGNSSMNFRIFIDRFNLSILEPYLEGVLHDIKGYTTAEVILKGTTEKPSFRGVVIFDRTAFTLDYTQTRYEITDWFDIAPDAIYFNDLRITDKYDHFGHINGKITHDNFEDIAMDIKFDSRNLMFLNTRRQDNDTFFGTVFATGNTRISGSLENMDVEISMKTDKNTKIFIPLESSEEVSQYDFITFKQPDTTLYRRQVEQVEISDESSEMAMGLEMNLNVTPEAEVQIIFDSKIGDIVKARGSTDLNITMDKSGDLSMYGDYMIEKGDYLFTLQDVFQKHLTIAKGSNISWAGDPLDAIVDIDAIYRVRRASIYDLTFNPDHQEIVVPVETHLLMTGGLEAPQIGFSLDLPSTVEEIQEQINNLPQEDMNKQVLSLLVMNRFLPLPGAQTAAKTESFGMESNASELLSNQVSNWLSQISGAVDIGFNYTPGDEVATQEMEFALSTQLLNNRVTIQSNVGLGGQQVDAAGSENASNIAGDFQVDVKLNRTGKLRVKAYAKSNEDIYTEAESTQGVGVFYREEFNTLGELWRKLFGSKPSKAKKNNSNK
jgi:hypothetical protein